MGNKRKMDEMAAEIAALKNTIAVLEEKVRNAEKAVKDNEKFRANGTNAGRNPFGNEGVIHAIMDLHGQGKSYNQIAKILNEKGIVSPTGKGWGKSSVYYIVKREEEKQKAAEERAGKQENWYFYSRTHQQRYQQMVKAMNIGSKERKKQAFFYIMTCSESLYGNISLVYDGDLQGVREDYPTAYAVFKRSEWSMVLLALHLLTGKEPKVKVGDTFRVCAKRYRRVMLQAIEIVFI